MSRRLIVALFRGTGAISSAIEWWTRGTASHMATLVLGDPAVPVMQIEAWSDGVNIRPQFDDHGATSIDYYEVVGATDGQIDNVIALAKQEVGSAYDYGAILGFVFRTHPKTAHPTKWICSELGYYLLRSSQIPVFALPADQAFLVDPDRFRWSTALTPIPNPFQK